MTQIYISKKNFGYINRKFALKLYFALFITKNIKWSWLYTSLLKATCGVPCNSHNHVAFIKLFVPHLADHEQRFDNGWVQNDDLRPKNEDPVKII